MQQSTTDRAMRLSVFYDRAQAATKLRVSISTVDRLIRSGELAAYKVGRRVVLEPQAVEAFKRSILRSHRKA